jgi:hypothetical protein
MSAGIHMTSLAQLPLPAQRQFNFEPCSSALAATATATHLDAADSLCLYWLRLYA